MSNQSPKPLRGEIWRVNFDPTVGAEIQKTRPAVVVNSDALGRLPIKLVAPLTGWQDHFSGNIWHVRIEPTLLTGLTKVSAVDALQLRGIDVQRFVQRLGRISSDVMEEIAAAIAAVIEYQ